MLAIVGRDEDHTPPPVASVSVVVVPIHNEEAPDILPAEGTGLTVIVFDADAEPQPLVTT